MFHVVCVSSFLFTAVQNGEVFFFLRAAQTPICQDVKFSICPTRKGTGSATGNAIVHDGHFKQKD